MPAAVPTPRELHLLNRMGCGFSPASYNQLRRAGDALAWFEQQLDPESIPEAKKALQVRSWFPRLDDSPTKIWQNNQDDVYQGWEYARDLSNYSLLRRIYSRRTVFENMVDFWSNHLHVEAGAFPAFTQRLAYDALIRKHALGSFADLLVEATLHPAMLLYLNNWRSVRGNPNENHGRELLELHSVGAAAGYTEQMVKDSAKILSGHTVDAYQSWSYRYEAARHTTGAVQVLGFSHANADAGDAGLAERYLRYLARHPATAQRIARKLAVRFVADDPTPGLVDRVADAYLRSGTDIKATLRALVNSDEFWLSMGQKFRTPADDVVATSRAMRVKAQAPVSGESYANALSWTMQSTLVYQWPRPDGPPDRAAAWASTTRMLNSWGMHWGYAGGWWPTEAVRHKKPASWLPRKRMRFRAFVDHLSRVILGRPADDRLLRAASEACDVRLGERITREHALIRWRMPLLLAVLLDSPEHMHR